MATGKSSGRQGSAEKLSPVPHTRIEDERMIDEVYEMGKKLGQGSFGVVREVIHRDTGEQWACKAVNKEKAGSSAIKLLEREVAILKRVHHEHIIRLKEVFETSKKMYLVMEYCEGGELADVLKEKLTFSEDETKKIMERLASAISYLHKNDMVHRDLKLENILLSKNPSDSSDNLYIKVTDFGLSVVKGGATHENMMMDFCGTPMYMAPEIIDNKTYSEKCDIWAMGVIMYNLLSGMLPFQSKDEEKLYEMIKTGDISKHFTDSAWVNITDEAKDVIRGLLMVDPVHRLTASELLDHPWITGAPSGASATKRLNVLEMMKEFREEMNGPDEEDGVVNGKGAVESTSKGDCSKSSRRDSGTSSGKSGKNGGKSSAGSGPGSGGQRRTLPRNTSETTKPKGVGTSGQRPVSKSPTDSARTTPRTQTSGTPPGYHSAARPAPTRTSNGAAKISQESRGKKKLR